MYKKTIDCPGRDREFTDPVYSGIGDRDAIWAQVQKVEHKYDPPKNEYSLFVGEMHGHTNLSDGGVDIDTYFLNLRDKAKVDFAAISDHDHGGVGRCELWDGGKWEKIQSKVREYYQPQKFTTLLAYERDSYPFYNNMVIYYRSDTGEMVRGEHDGEITYSELKALLARDDVIVIPHDTYSLSSGGDFKTMPQELFTPLIELYSRGDACEFFGNPAFCAESAIEGGFWRDALERGAYMGCIAGSDDHTGRNGQNTDEPYPRKFPGLTGVWAKENTREAIFDAIKARRCFAFMGGRMSLDFRINGHYMGEEFSLKKDEPAYVWFNASADENIVKASVIKNGRDIAVFYKNFDRLFIDNAPERDVDYYYLRVELDDGRFGWSSPVWIKRV